MLWSPLMSPLSLNAPAIYATYTGPLDSRAEKAKAAEETDGGACDAEPDSKALFGWDCWHCLVGRGSMLHASASGRARSGVERFCQGRGMVVLMSRFSMLQEQRNATTKGLTLLTCLLGNNLLVTTRVLEPAGIGALSVIIPRTDAYRRALPPRFISLAPSAPVRRTTTLVAAE